MLIRRAASCMYAASDRNVDRSFVNLKLFSYKKYCLNAILSKEKVASFGTYNHAVQSVSRNSKTLCTHARVRACVCIYRVFLVLNNAL